ncbi:hypothetical protein BDZ91DRAFT_481471 [Kalaharituber pfeilii]|nr:hypothetical protein BDZ91DRAFT_481471 [Kalaharituber pfeilii]
MLTGHIQIEFLDVSYWRNNLVAFSKRYNYLFIALKASIYVYQPTYPSQKLPEKPLYILNSEPVNQPVGYIDPQNPHAVNSLTVGELGIEEVLVSAHDDGDACVWYTRDLTRIALRMNVDVSAWGVALHKEKRLLAVSANSHLIHVYQLGIGEEERKAKRARRNQRYDVSQEMEYERWEKNATKELDGSGPNWTGPSSQNTGASDGHGIQNQPQLKQKEIKVLRGHEHNIPNISFLDDPSGNWLVSTSIDGLVIIWDIETEKEVKRSRLCLERGWSCLFLSPECFLPVRDHLEGLGVPGDPENPTCAKEIQTKGDTYNIILSSSMQRGQAQAYNSQRAFESGSEDEYTEEYDDDDEEFDFDDISEDLDQNEAEDYNGDYETYNGNESSEMGSSVDYSMEEAGDDDTDADSWVNSLRPQQPVRVHRQQRPEPRQQNRRAQFPEVSSGPIPTARSGRQDSSASGQRSDAKILYSKAHLRPLPPMPQSIVFAATVSHVQLLEVPSLSKLVVCQKVLNSIPSLDRYTFLRSIDRLNMVCVIPELSMVVAASQKGTAAIFRLTQSDEEYMMRIDGILPPEARERPRNTNDEDLHARPCSPLLGLAVGPIQGREFGRSRSNSEDDFAGKLGSDGEDEDEAKIQVKRDIGMWRRRKRGIWRGVEKRRRYRMMMVYMDGTILSYELGGARETELVGNTAVDGGYLMV